MPNDSDNVIPFTKPEAQGPKYNWCCACGYELYHLTELGPECYRCGSLKTEYPLFDKRSDT